MVNTKNILIPDRPCDTYVSRSRRSEPRESFAQVKGPLGSSG